MKRRFTEEQIIGFLREAEAGLPITELCCKHGVSKPSGYAWKAKFGSMKVSDAQRLKALEGARRRSKALEGARRREHQAHRSCRPTRCSRSMRCAKCSRESEGRGGTARGGARTAGPSQRQALRLVDMNRSTLRDQPRGDGNAGLRERLKQLAGQHRRHGYRMPHNRLRHEGWPVNVKRACRRYREERLMVRARRRKKLPVPERQPLLRPQQPNEVWRMDFVFDELAGGRRIKTLTVVDDCGKEAIRIAVGTAMPALYVTRLLDQARAEQGLPEVIRTDNGPEFAGRTMQSWAADNGGELRFIQPGKPVQNAHIESFNSRLRDEYLSQHWFAGRRHMRSVIDHWRDDYDHHRPRSALGYLPPAVFTARCRQQAGGNAQTTASATVHSPGL